MTLTIIGSNSAGNCYVLQNESEALILECGMPFPLVQRALDFNLGKVAAALVTHEHGDHFKYVSDFQKRGVQVYASAGTWKAKGIKGNVLQHGELTKIGNFKVLPFNVKHDCAEPLGFLIDHPETGQILFATDTYYIPFKFSNINHWMIECNYRKDILDKNCPAGSFKKILRDRTLESHMSYETCEKALLANDLSQTRTITLIHLSDGNSHAGEFKSGIEKATGIKTYVAEKNMKINFKKMPF